MIINLYQGVKGSALNATLKTVLKNLPYLTNDESIF